MRVNNDEPTLQQRLNSETVRRRFEELLDKSAPSFISSILSIFNSNKKLQECSSGSIVAAAGIAAALKLPINPSLGFAFLVPYKGHATFQLGAKGYVQLAMRSGQYRTLNSGPVREGQIAEIDFVTGEIVRGEKISDEIVGYVAYMELLNGFKKAMYMTVDELREHAEKYSQSYAYDLRYGKKSSVWSTNFDVMAKKTVLKRLLNNFGIISIDPQGLDMATALQADQAVITKDGLRYPDNEVDGSKIVPFNSIIDLPTDDEPDDADNSPDTPTDDSTPQLPEPDDSNDNTEEDK